MKTITLTQPFATLMASGAKMIETRGWRPHGLTRGDLVAIHAAKGIGDAREYAAICASEPFKRALAAAFHAGLIESHLGDGHCYPGDLPRGAIVAVARFDQAKRTEQVTGISAEERAFGHYGYGRWAWVFDKVEPVWPPIPAKGQLYIWNWTPPVGFTPGGVHPAAEPVRSLWDAVE